MNRWLSIALFVVAVVALFITGRIEASRSQAVLESARDQLDVQISKESSGRNSPADRAIFLKKQKQILNSIHRNSITRSATAPAPAPTSSEPTNYETSSPAIAPYMPYLVTAILGLASLWMILFKTDDEGRKWAFATLGTIVGYWLKG